MSIRPAEPRARIVDEQTFALVAELEMRKAMRLQYYVSLLARAPAAAARPPALAAALAGEVARAIRPELRATDLIGLEPTSPCLYVLLVSAALPALPVVIDRLGVEVARHRFSLGRGDERVRLAIGGACFPSTARDERDLFSQAATLLGEAREDEGEGYRYRLARARG